MTLLFCPNMPVVTLPELAAFYMGNTRNRAAWDLRATLTAAKKQLESILCITG